MSAGDAARRHATTILRTYRKYCHPNPVPDWRCRELSGLSEGPYNAGKLALRLNLDAQEQWVYVANHQGWRLTDDEDARREMLQRRSRGWQQQIRNLDHSTVAPFAKRDPILTRRFHRLMASAEQELQDLIDTAGAP